MSRALIISPHTDDAIFSIGTYLTSSLYATSASSTTILSPMAAIPDDDAGCKKHTILTAEHKKVCEHLDFDFINGPFLDDVYSPRPSAEEVRDYILSIIDDFDCVYIPLGIHHPDHVLVSDAAIEAVLKTDKSVLFYEELPYRVLYPELCSARRDHIESIFNAFAGVYQVRSNKLKHDLVRMYESQTRSAELLQALSTIERVRYV